MHTHAGRLNAILNRTLDCFVGCWIGYQSRNMYIVYMMKLLQALYEFVYRAISDYVDLYRNKDEEYEYSVPVGAVNNSGTTKSVKSVQSAKSNGSGPYCMPVGSTNTGKSSGSGSS